MNQKIEIRGGGGYPHFYLGSDAHDSKLIYEVFFNFMQKFMSFIVDEIMKRMYKSLLQLQLASNSSEVYCHKHMYETWFKSKYSFYNFQRHNNENHRKIAITESFSVRIFLNSSGTC